MGGTLPPAFPAWLHGPGHSHRLPRGDLELVLTRGPTFDGRVTVFVELHHGRIARLSARENQVLALVAEGLTNSQIATRLDVRPRTVDKHLENVYAKLGVGNRTAAARASGLGRGSVRRER
jgi:DNA-binding CsgD family transcriptional regulator